jgi:flagellar biosynthesis component FlhA
VEQLIPQAQSLSLLASDSSCVSCRSSIVKEEQEQEEEEEEEEEEKEEEEEQEQEEEEEQEQGEQEAVRSCDSGRHSHHGKQRAPGHTLKRFQGVTRKLFQKCAGWFDVLLLRLLTGSKTTGKSSEKQ